MLFPSPFVNKRCESSYLLGMQGEVNKFGLLVYPLLKVKKNFLAINLVPLEAQKLSMWALLDKKTLDCSLIFRLSVIIIFFEPYTECRPLF